MNRVNPPKQLVLPQSIQADTDQKKAFDDRDFILFQIWKRIGGGADLIDQNVTGLYEFDNLAEVVNSLLPSLPDVKVITADYTTIGDQTLICNAALTVLLNTEPKDREQAKVIIANGDVTVSGNGKQLNKNTSQTVLFDSLITPATLDIIYVLESDEWFIV